MEHKSKFKGAEIDARLGNIYFHTIPVEVMEKIYNLENLSISQGEEIFENGLKAYKIVFPENTLTPENNNQFYELGYREGQVASDVALFELQQVIFDIVDGVVTMRGYIYRFTREGDHFTVTEL